ncbi:MAG: hypothetical protein IK140_05575 [Clostridia bacterium]|nr:hypothetical protein [Clostridia bacterium]
MLWSDDIGEINVNKMLNMLLEGINHWTRFGLAWYTFSCAWGAILCTQTIYKMAPEILTAQASTGPKKTHIRKEGQLLLPAEQNNKASYILNKEGTRNNEKEDFFDHTQYCDADLGYADVSIRRRVASRDIGFCGGDSEFPRRSNRRHFGREEPRILRRIR